MNSPQSSRRTRQAEAWKLSNLAFANGYKLAPAPQFSVINLSRPLEKGRRGSLALVKVKA
jgi:hypothetical protein